MRIAVTGASGFIGTAVRFDLEGADHEVVRLVRHSAGQGEVRWDPSSGQIDSAALGRIDAVVHLAGESIAASRWTPARKARIRDSRITGTQLLATTLAALSPPPQVLVCASASGWYGDRGDAVLREDAPAGAGFLATTCRAWEAAADPARQHGIRVTHLRIGLVLDPNGGVLERILPVFRAGLGAPLGSGRQWWSWITRRDLVRVVRFALENDVAGPVNAVAPEMVTNATFTRILCHALHRRMLPVRVPRFVLQALFGEMADEGLLASARLSPARLRAAGFRFDDPELEPALERLLMRR
jgi:uncharacterized protein (TIGR01777 family)